jgi:2-oxoglutarate dehydrogenase E2 component (dihydrolipoamide succinyltransferase)
MTRLRQTIAKRLKECAEHRRAAHHLQRCRHERGDRGAQQATRTLFEKKHGVKLGFMGFFAKAVVPGAEGRARGQRQIEGDEIVYHDYADLSVAVSAPNGLVVPVVRNVGP